MRRTFSSLLLTVALLAGTLALAAHVADRAVAGPGRVGAALKGALDSPQTRAALRKDVSRRVAASVPGVSRRRAAEVADRVLADPRLPAAVDALVSAGPAQRRRAVDRALSTLATRDPALARRVRAEAGTVLPGLRLPYVDRLDAVHRRLDGLRSLGTVVAVVLGALALLVGPRRDRLVRRIGVWGILVGGLGAALVWLLPGALDAGPAWALVVAGGLRAARTSLTALFAALCAAGLVLVALGAGAGRGRGTGRGARRGRTRRSAALH
jgi:hypothetical protein